MKLDTFLLGFDGGEILRAEGWSDDVSEAAALELGERLAQDLRDRGAEQILAAP